jgi:hypothetical protein
MRGSAPETAKKKPEQEGEFLPRCRGLEDLAHPSLLPSIG